MPASFSSTAFGVRPGAWACRRCFSVTHKPYARKAMRMWASNAMFYLMINRPNSQLTLQTLKGRFDLRQLHVAVPQHLGIFPRQIGAQQIMSIAPLRFLQLAALEPELEGLASHFFLGLGHADLHETEGPSGFTLGCSDLHQQRITRRTHAPQGPQPPQQPCQLASTDGHLFRLAACALRQHIQLAFLREQFHLYRLAHLPPRQFRPLRFVLPDLAPWRPHQVKHLPPRGAHLRQQFFTGNSPIHHPHPPCLAVHALDLVQKTAQAVPVGSIPLHHFVGQRETFRRQHQGDHHLPTVEPPVPAVTVAGFGNRFRLSFHIGAGEIVEEQIKARRKEVLPPQPQVLEQLRLVRQYSIQTTIEPVLLGHREVHCQQLGHGGLIEPVPMHTEFAARLDQPVHHQQP